MSLVAMQSVGNMEDRAIANRWFLNMNPPFLDTASESEAIQSINAHWSHVSRGVIAMKQAIIVKIKPGSSIVTSLELI